MRGIMKITSVAAALALVAMPLAAQGGPGRGTGAGMGRGMMQGGPEAMARNPVAVVLDHQEELELTAAQVESLEGLRARLEEENGPRWEQLRSAFGDVAPAELTVEERQALRARMQELAPVRQEIREANRAVMTEVHELLSDEQETALRGIMRRGPQGPAGPGMRGRGPGDRMVGAAWLSGFRAGHRAARQGNRPLARPGG